MAKTYIGRLKRSLLLGVLFTLASDGVISAEGILGQRLVNRSKPGIVDGAGYAIQSNALVQDGGYLAMDANAGGAQGGSLGQVSLTPFVHSRSQSWGVAFYGGKSAELSSSINRDNLVTTYYNEGSSLPRSRHYLFDTDDSNETFMIRNEETGFCLEAAFPPPGNGEADKVPFIAFAKCDKENPFQGWIFQRTG